MRLRNHLLEAGPQRQMADRSQCQQYGHHRTKQQKRPATVEDKPSKQAAGSMIDVPRIAHARHQIVSDNIAIHGISPVAVAPKGAVGLHPLPESSSEERRLGKEGVTSFK